MERAAAYLRDLERSLPRNDNLHDAMIANRASRCCGCMIGNCLRGFAGVSVGKSWRLWNAVGPRASSN
jgi:hypothetical protein